MPQSQEIKDLALALSKAQAEITGAVKDSKNPFFKSNYADLESVWSAIRGPLTKNQLCVIQTTEIQGTATGIVTTLAHSSGQWIQGFYPLSPIKQDPQGIGSAMTYARRYALAAMVGVVQVDDDGEAAMARVKLSNGIVAPMIKPEQPGPEDGTSHAESYKIPFGKFKQRSLEEVGADDLRKYVEYLEESAKKKGQEITGMVADFIARAEDFIGCFENASFSGDARE